MLHVLSEIIFPIFAVIFIGYGLSRKGVIGLSFIQPANRIVYYIAIPAMLFKAIAPVSFRESCHMGAVLSLLGAVGATVIIGWGAMRLLQIAPKRRGTFLQSSFHGNIGYIAYAVAYYALGEERFAFTAILSSFIIVAQNFLAVWVLVSQRPGEGREARIKALIKSVLFNPVILTVVAGTSFSLSGLPLSAPVERFLMIVSGMALPTALLLIGATLSFKSLQKMMKEVVGVGLLKLICLPALGYLFMTAAHVPEPFQLSVTILLAAPPATVVYIMAKEIGGDPELAATCISIHTLAAAATYSLFLGLLMPQP
jgi:hypothetical protein